MPSSALWDIETVTAVATQLDVSSSNQGTRQATAVDAAGVRLCNALELIEVEPEATQVEVCTQCGFTGCAPRGWVTIRRLGDNVVWLPAWTEMEEGPQEASEYAPPAFFENTGAPVFRPALWQQLRDLCCEFPAHPDLPRVDTRDLVRLTQWVAPGQVLGRPPKPPTLARDLLLAVTDGELTDAVDAVEASVQSYHSQAEPVALEPDATVSPIEFWLDLPGTPSWSAFGRIGDEVVMLMDGSTPALRTR